MKVTIFGTGYVGLITSVCLADIGHKVVCVDIDADKIQMLQAGQATLYEPRLDDFLARNIAA